MKEKKHGSLLAWLIAALVLLLALGAGAWLALGCEWREVSFTAAVYTPSADDLEQPDCGMYRICPYRVCDEGRLPNMDLWAGSHQLVLVQLNLADYAGGAISQAGLEHIDELLTAFDEQTDGYYIVRLLYDWEGSVTATEPESMDVVTTHITQLGPVLMRHAARIYVLQGVLIGNWGEINGSRFSNYSTVRMLAQHMVAMTGGALPVSLRTPVQWRYVTGTNDPKAAADPASFAGHIALYNDGMLGSETDCGTYGYVTKQQAGAEVQAWMRQDELAFQDVLCRYVPNGGEVIINNPLNDFDAAVTDLARMHVSYLNQAYDAEVYLKWAGVTINDGSCYDGMNGLTFISRHLGYRYQLHDISLERTLNSRFVTVDARLGNEGFAPVYRDLALTYRLTDDSGSIVLEMECDADLRKLCGMSEPDERVHAACRMDLRSLADGSYTLWLTIYDPKTGLELELANEQTPGPLGYEIGKLMISQ